MITYYSITYFTFGIYHFFYFFFIDSINKTGTLGEEYNWIKLGRQRFF